MYYHISILDKVYTIQVYTVAWLKYIRCAPKSSKFLL